MIEINFIVMYLFFNFILNFHLMNPFFPFFIFYVFYVSSYDVSFSFFSFSLNFFIFLMIYLIKYLILIKFLIIQIILQVNQNLKFDQEVHSVEGVIHLIISLYGNFTYLYKLILYFFIKHLIII
jgi:hypothetical protein